MATRDQHPDCRSDGELIIFQESEIIGEHFSRFYRDEDRATGLPQRALETAQRQGKFEAKGGRVRKDGSRFWAYVIIDPICDGKGNLVGYAKVTRDLTERTRVYLVPLRLSRARHPG